MVGDEPPKPPRYGLNVTHHQFNFLKMHQRNLWGEREGALSILN